MGELQPSNAPKMAQLAFAHYILDGRSTVDAYRMAGYKGEAHAAYTLRGRLDDLIAAEASKRGFTKSGVAAGLVALNEIPVNIPADGVSIDQKLKILGLQAKIHAEEPVVDPRLKRFPIGSFVEAEVVDGEKDSTIPAGDGPADLHPEQQVPGGGVGV